MRISDWSSDVCSSDLRRDIGGFAGAAPDRDRDLLFQTGSVFPGGESVSDRAMPRPAKPALARIARTLCSRAGHPEIIQFEGKPMWQRFLAAAHAALVAIREASTIIVEAVAKSEGKRVGGLNSREFRSAWSH